MGLIVHYIVAQGKVKYHGLSETVQLAN